MPIPFLRPRPARLSELSTELRAIEESRIFSNFGPVNERLEDSLTRRLFGGRGGCVTVANATLGLMIAIREAVRPGPPGRFALMPAFTFAAAAHAADWAGLTPLLADIDPDTWAPDPSAEDKLLQRYAGRVACVIPYATFGNGLDLDRYSRLGHDGHIGVVVDAAGSLGSIDADGLGFGARFPHAVVFSMHATKPFATAEGGVIHCGDHVRLQRLRAMTNFGFEQTRSASLPGLNAKLSEVGALMALAKLNELDEVVKRRAALVYRYRALLPELEFQHLTLPRVAHQFVSVLLPPDQAWKRDAVTAAMEARGIGVRTYFSPHLAQQPWFARTAEHGDLTTTDDVAQRVLSLPLADEMTEDEVEEVCSALLSAMDEAR